MKYFIFFLFAISSIGESWAQLPELIPYRHGRLFGFSDSTKRIVIEPKYERVHGFKEGLAMVRKNGKYGFIDNHGEVVIPIKYNYAQDFCLGYAKVGKSKSEAYCINVNGNKVEEPSQYDLLKRNEERYHLEVLIFHDELSRYGLIHRSGKVIAEPVYQKIYESNGNFWKARNWNQEYTFLNSRGQEVFRPRKGKFGDHFYEGLCGLKSEDGKSMIYFDTTGSTIFTHDFQFEYAGQETGMFDPIDKEGLHFSEGKLGVNHRGKYGFIDNKGQVLIPFKYDRVWNFKDGFAKVKLDGKYGFINHSGEFVGRIDYDEVNHFYEGRAFVKVGEKCGYINAQGEEVIALELDHWQFEQFYNFKDGLAQYKVGERIGLIDTNGQVVLAAEYDQVERVSTDLLIVKRDAKYGLYKLDGSEIFPVQYKYIQLLKNGTIQVHQDGLNALYDPNGQEIFPFKFQRIEPWWFDEELMIGSIPGKYSERYFIDRHGVEYRE